MINSERIRRMILITLAASLGTWMAAVGLAGRITGEIPDALAAGLGLAGLHALGLSVDFIAWGAVCLGVFWWASAASFWARNAWGWYGLFAASALSCACFPGGTIAAALVLGLNITFRQYYSPTKD